MNFIKSNLISIILAIGLIVLGTIMIVESNKKPKVIEVEYTRHSVYDIECELKYWAIKAELVDSVQSYMDKVAPNHSVSALVLLNECLDGNITIMFALSQGIKESHFATKGIGGKINNIFNVHVYDNMKAKDVPEEYRPNHPNLSIKPYVKLLNKRYLVNGKTEADLLKKYVDINGNRYASYPKYEEELTIIYNRICNTTKIKELYDKLLCYGLKLNY